MKFNFAQGLGALMAVTLLSLLAVGLVAAAAAFGPWVILAFFASIVFFVGAVA